jgi:hypothetical protein
MQPSGCAVVRQRHVKAVVVTFLMGCAVLLVVGCAGMRSEAPQKKEQGRTEATKEQARSDRCEGTRTIKLQRYVVVVTNDVPGCPNGGLLSGTDKVDRLAGMKGDDEIHGLGGPDELVGGDGNDVIYGGGGHDMQGISGGRGEDVLYGGGGNDILHGTGDGGQRDKLYCGEGRDAYRADENDYVDSSCEMMAKTVMV